MKRILLLFFVLLLVSNNIDSVVSDNKIIIKSRQSDKIKEIEKHIKDFYVAYCTWIDKGTDKTTGDKLCKKYLTHKLIGKIEKVGRDHDYDLIIYGQDFNRTGTNSLAVRHIEGDWYAVSYYSAFNQHCVIIPVKIMILNGVIKIDDIIESECNEKPQPDKMMEIQKEIKRFYTIYCDWMVSKMSHNVRDMIRDQFLTKKMIEKVEEVYRDHNYDLIVHAQYLYGPTSNTLDVRHINRDWYAVSYHSIFGDRCIVIPVKAIILNGVIKIDDIQE